MLSEESLWFRSVHQPSIILLFFENAIRFFEIYTPTPFSYFTGLVEQDTVLWYNHIKFEVANKKQRRDIVDYLPFLN